MQDSKDNMDSHERQEKLLRAENERLRLQLEDKIRMLRNSKNTESKLKRRLARKEKQIEMLAGVKGRNVTLSRQAREIEKLNQKIEELTGGSEASADSDEPDDSPFEQLTLPFD